MKLDEMPDKHKKLFKDFSRRYSSNTYQRIVQKRRIPEQKIQPFSANVDVCNELYEVETYYEDTVQIDISTDALMYLLENEAASQHRGSFYNHKDHMMEKYFVMEMREKEEQTLREKHYPLQKIWEKYKFTRELITGKKMK